MGRLAEAMPKTISASDQVPRSGCPPDTRRQAGDLLQALAAIECHFSVGGAAAVPAGLLRDLAVITAELAGPSGLETGADGTTVFTALHATWQPPPLPELDQILALRTVGPVRGGAASGRLTLRYCWSWDGA